MPRGGDHHRSDPPAVIALGGIEQHVLAAASLGGSIAVTAGALALGLRHGIDWDHIAAITDITSATAVEGDEGDERDRGGNEHWLTREPGLQLTDESHHGLAQQRAGAGGAGAATAGAAGAAGAVAVASRPARVPRRRAVARQLRRRRHPIWLGTLYALGHGTVVTALGLLAILASGFLPAWIDPIMSRVVGATLLLLAAYLYYSVYRYFRGGEFHLRSRWMLVFVGVRNGYRWLAAKLQRHDYHRVAHSQAQYGARTAYGIGMIHGVGAETGTQVLLIATAVGASSRAAGMAALFAFVLGLLISNSVVTVATAAGFVSASRRQGLYVGAGVLAATFSLVLGVAFLFAREAALPALDEYFRWIGGPG